MFIFFVVIHTRFRNINESHHEKANNVVSEQVRHKPSCTITKIARDVKFGLLYYPSSETKGADTFRNSAPLFPHMQNGWFSYDAAQTMNQSFIAHTKT